MGTDTKTTDKTEAVGQTSHTGKADKANGIRQAFEALALGAEREMFAATILKGWSPKEAGYTSMEHAIACTFKVASLEDKTDARTLRTLKVTVGEKTVTVEAIAKAARRAMRKAAEGKQGDKALTPDKITSRLNRLAHDAAVAGLEMTTINAMEKAIKTLKANMAKAADKGHHMADKEPEQKVA